MQNEVFNYSMNMMQTVAFAILLLVIGRFIKSKVNFLQKYFIPAAVIGGGLFSIILLIGHNTGTFTVSFNGEIKDFLMVAFFTGVGFSASFRELKKGGIGVVLFLIAAVILVIIQNVLGIGMAKALGLNPLLGLAAGSIPLTGGHGTSGAFGPYLEELGCQGALVVAIASATYGLVSGCIIGGPIGRKLLIKHKLVGTEGIQQRTSAVEGEAITEKSVFNAIVCVGIAMGVGVSLNPFIKQAGLTLPIYISTMFIAVIMRNVMDYTGMHVPFTEINLVGNISLELFLSMALMSMKLWQLADLALPLIIMLIVQTIVMGLFAYYVTFNIMGRDYDAAVIACGHCGFGLGATPNAMANMETFCSTNGFSTKAFLAVPIVGSLFIDMINAAVITTFAQWALNNLM